VKAAEEHDRHNGRGSVSAFLSGPYGGGDHLWGGRIFTAEQLMAEDFPPVRWAVPGIMPEGLSVLAGHPKIGKGWLVLGTGIAIATGGVALGKVRVQQGDCLYLALEDNRRRLYGRIGKLLGNRAAPPRLHLVTDWPPLDEGGLEDLDDWLAIHPDARAVFIDTLKMVRPRVSGNKGIYDADYEALEPLVPLAAEHRVAIVVVHHTRKLAAADPLDEISGSTGLSGAADGVLVLKRDRGRADAYLHVTGREIEEEAELALRWDPDTAGWTLAGDAAEYRLNEERTRVLRVLEEAGEPMGPREVADTLGGDYNATRQRLYQMGRSGEVQVISRGRYTIPNKLNNPNKPITEADPDVRVAQTSPNNRESQEGRLDAGSEQDVRDVRDVRSDYDRLVEERVADLNSDCIHGYSHGKGCYVCDPERPYRKSSA
jgi:hypothetical protein